RRLKDEGLTESVEDELNQRFSTANDILDEFNERGTTIGAKEFDGSHIIEIPVVPLSKIKPFERVILFKLAETGVFESVSDLSEALADDLDEEHTDSFRSKVIYNTRSLAEKGYIEQVERGKSHETRLSRLGWLWVESHSRSDEVEEFEREKDGEE
ncbi:MAG: aspartate kinase, partial [Halobacteria archaeon]|nr:aspartate kinase [Halobacteria archaeon]